MSILTISQLSKFSAGILAFGGIVYEMGKQSQKLGDLIPRIYAMERDHESKVKIAFNIHGKLSSIEEKIANMEKELIYIRDKLDKS